MNYFTYRGSFRKLNRKWDEANKVLSKAIEEARKSGEEKPEETYEVGWQRHICEGTDEEISSLVSRYVLSKAYKKFLPVPSISKNSEYWEKGYHTGDLYLTNKGITEIRNLLRKDNKEKMEMCFPWITVLFGFIGAITGLVAVIKG